MKCGGRQMITISFDIICTFLMQMLNWSVTFYKYVKYFVYLSDYRYK